MLLIIKRQVAVLGWGFVCCCFFTHAAHAEFVYGEIGGDLAIGYTDTSGSFSEDASLDEENPATRLINFPGGMAARAEAQFNEGGLTGLMSVGAKTQWNVNSLSSATAAWNSEAPEKMGVTGEINAMATAQYRYYWASSQDNTFSPLSISFACDGLLSGVAEGLTAEFAPESEVALSYRLSAGAVSEGNWGAAVPLGGWQLGFSEEGTYCLGAAECFDGDPLTATTPVSGSRDLGFNVINVVTSEVHSFVVTLTVEVSIFGEGLGLETGGFVAAQSDFLTTLGVTGFSENVSTVPEPTPVVMLVLAIGALALRRRPPTA